MKPQSAAKSVVFIVCFVAALGVGSAASIFGFGAEIPETSHLAFVTEFVRELSAIEDIRAAAERQQKKGESDGPLADDIYLSTRLQLRLRVQIGMLTSMRLNPPFETLIPDLTSLYTSKIAAHQQLIDIASALMSGPKPGVDYAEVAAKVPKISAVLDSIDESIFKLTPLVFLTLVDMKEDSKHHVSHLNITKVERAKLLSDITTAFGSKLAQKDQNYTVGAASVLKTNLLKDFKSSDDPWE